MSFKVYNGHVMRDPDPIKFYKKMKDLKKKSIAILEAHFKEELSEDFKKRESFEELKKRLFEAVTSMTKGTPDYTYKICFAFKKDKILLIPFQFMKLYPEPKYMKYHGYWNNTDPDERCTSKEWREREVDWERMFKHDDVPSEAMMTLNIIDIVDIDRMLWRVFMELEGS